MPPTTRYRTMSTVSGAWLDAWAPEPDDVDIDDIAHSLSRICRYNGHTQDHYSVAEHSVLVSKAVPRQWALHGLLHDAAEAYIGDWPCNLKPLLLVQRPRGDAPWPYRTPCVPFKAVESHVMAAICERYALDWPWDTRIINAVGHADRAVAAAEVAALFPNYHDPEWQLAERADVTITPHRPGGARSRFLERFHNLHSRWRGTRG